MSAYCSSVGLSKAEIQYMDTAAQLYPNGRYSYPKEKNDVGSSFLECQARSDLVKLLKELLFGSERAKLDVSRTFMTKRPKYAW